MKELIEHLKMELKMKKRTLEWARDEQVKCEQEIIKIEKYIIKLERTISNPPV